MQASIDKIEKKKFAQVLKILEEWLKNYQSISQADSNDEIVIREVVEPALVLEKKITPFDNPQFCEFLYGLFEKNMLDVGLVEETSFYHGPKQVVSYQLGLEINTTIELLNVICIVNQEQYLRVFRTEQQTQKLLEVMTGIFTLHELCPQQPIAVPSVLKAAVIKTFGYLIQHEQGRSKFTTSDFVCN